MGLRSRVGTVVQDRLDEAQNETSREQSDAPKTGPALVDPQSPREWLDQRLSALRSSLKSFRAILRLRPFDTTTAEGRSNERYRRATLTTLSSIVARALGIFTGLAWLHLALSYLGKERYGLWMTVGSLIAWANLADLGLARGMQNHLSQANGRDDRELAARYISTGFFLLVLIALGFGVVLAPVVHFVSWTRVLNVQDPLLADEARLVVGAVVLCFLVQFPLSIVPTIYAAYQRGYVTAIFNILGSIVSLGTLFLVTRIQLSLPLLILMTSAAGICLTLVNFGYALKEMPWLRPRLRLATRATLRTMVSTSVALFVFQIGALLINETQSVIIARRLGLTYVADWSVFMRVHLLPFIFIQMIDTPLIPAFREAHVRGEREWLRTAFWRITRIKMWISVVAAALLLFFGNSVAILISGQHIVFPWQMWAASGAFLLIAVWCGSFNDLMIATDRLRLLVITILINGVVTLFLSYLAAPKFGLVGIVLATPLFSLVVNAWLMPLACADLLKRRGNT